MITIYIHTDAFNFLLWCSGLEKAASIHHPRFFHKNDCIDAAGFFCGQKLNSFVICTGVDALCPKMGTVGGT